MPDREESPRITPQKIKERILALDPKRYDHGHVYLLPIMCGLGKSTAISMMVKDNLYSGSKGLLILTDRKDSFAAYTNPRDDEEYAEMLRAGGIFDITEMDSENIYKTRIEQKKVPILIACTQRLFQSSDDEIHDLITWNGGVRPYIIIDEKPPLLLNVSLSLEKLNDAAELLSSLYARGSEADERDWCEEQWDRIVKALKSRFRDYERECHDHYSFTCYFRPCPDILEDEERLLSFIGRNKTYFGPNIVNQTITCAICLVKEGGLITCRRSITEKKNNFGFHMLLDQREKVINLPALTVILDGTGDVSPEYRQDYVITPPGAYCTRDLSKLRIIIVNVPTSKENLKDKDDKAAYAKAMKDFLNKRHPVDERKVVFTYKDDCEEAFIDIFGQENVNHFGRIKGSNEYNDTRVMTQFGLFMLPPVYYLQLYLNAHREEYEAVKTMEPAEAAAYLDALQKSDAVWSLVHQSLLADVEQNFFRSKIRMADNEDEICFYLFMNTDTNASLIRLMKERYEPLGAQVDDSMTDPPMEFAFAKAMNRHTQDQEKTMAQLVRHWIDSLRPARKNGKVYFTTDDLCNSVGITKRQFSALKRKYPEMMAGCTETEKGQWVKQGIFSGTRKRK